MADRLEDEAPQSVPGFEAERFENWLASRVDGFTPPFSISALSGGRSNLTAMITDAAGRRLVARRPPIHGVLPSAHDMEREYRIQHALHDSGVPVPGMVGLETDPAVLGAPFYVMDFVEGRVLRDVTDAACLTESVRKRIGFELSDTLQAIHDVDPHKVGLDFVSDRPYLRRQLRTWIGQLEALGADDDERTGALIVLGHRLERDVPVQQKRCVVHGDFRLDNVVMSPEGEVVVVLDWELWTVGDPLADLATFAIYWSQADDAVLPLGSAAMLLPGFASRDEVVERYRSATGLDLVRFTYYLAFATWRLATILEGVLQRQRSGSYGEGVGVSVDGGEEWERLMAVVPALTVEASGLLDRDRVRSKAPDWSEPT